MPKRFPKQFGGIGERTGATRKVSKAVAASGPCPGYDLRKRPGHPCYRLYRRIQMPDGKPRSRMKDFGAYAKAKREGDKLVSDLVRGSTVTTLTPGQARAAFTTPESQEVFRKPPAAARSRWRAFRSAARRPASSKGGLWGSG